MGMRARRERRYALARLSSPEVQQLIEHLLALKAVSAPVLVVVRQPAKEVSRNKPGSQKSIRFSEPKQSQGNISVENRTNKSYNHSIYLQRVARLRQEHQEDILLGIEHVRQLHLRNCTEELLDKCSPLFYKHESVLHRHEKILLLFFLGTAQAKLGYLIDAEHSYTQAFNEKGPPNGPMSLIHANYAVLMSSQHKLQLALRHFRKAVQIHSLGCDSPYRLLLGRTYHSLAGVYFATDMFEQAAKYYGLAGQEKKLEGEERVSVLSSKLMWAKSLLKAGRLEEATLSLAELKQEPMPLRMELTVAKELGHCYRRTGCFSKAIWEYYSLVEHGGKECRKYLGLIKEIEQEAGGGSQLPFVNKVQDLEQ